MKLNYIFTLLILAFASCSTEDSNEEPTPPVSANDCRINSTTYSDEFFSYQYEDNKATRLISSEREVIVDYDNQNRIIGYEVMDIENEQIQTKKEFGYNSNGLLVEERNYDLYMDDLIPTSRFEYEYEDSRVIRINDYDMDSGEFEGKTEYSWENGNIVSSSFYDENNELECITEFTFDTSAENPFKIDFREFYFLELYDSDFDEVIFFSENLLDTSRNLCGAETTNWNFTFDDKGLLTGAKVDNNTYWQLTYNCN